MALTATRTVVRRNSFRRKKRLFNYTRETFSTAAPTPVSRSFRSKMRPPHRQTSSVPLIVRKLVGSFRCFHGTVHVVTYSACSLGWGSRSLTKRAQTRFRAVAEDAGLGRVRDRVTISTTFRPDPKTTTTAFGVGVGVNGLKNRAGDSGPGSFTSKTDRRAPVSRALLAASLIRARNNSGRPSNVLGGPKLPLSSILVMPATFGRKGSRPDARPPSSGVVWGGAG